MESREAIQMIELRREVDPWERNFRVEQIEQKLVVFQDSVCNENIACVFQWHFQ